MIKKTNFPKIFFLYDVTERMWLHSHGHTKLTLELLKIYHTNQRQKEHMDFNEEKGTTNQK